MPARTAAVVGGSGLVGGQLLRLLADDPDYVQVTALLRRPLEPAPAASTLRQVLVDFERPESLRAYLSVHAVFCCLGTTIKKAGSQEAFRKVDYGYPLAVAKEALAAGARQFLIITAVGANAKSRVFYNRVKGEVEEALFALPFAGGVTIVRPSMLLGDRAESRPAEHVAAALMKATAPLFAGNLKRYRAIDAAEVARALWNAARYESPGVHIYEGAPLFELAARPPSGYEPASDGAQPKR